MKLTPLNSVKNLNSSVKNLNAIRNDVERIAAVITIFNSLNSKTLAIRQARDHLRSNKPAKALRVLEALNL